MTSRLHTPASPEKCFASGRSAAFEQRIRDAFDEFVGDARFPCLAAKTTLRPDDEHLRVYGVLGSTVVSDSLAVDLARFARQASSAGNRLTAFAAIFTGRPPASERAFERRLWGQLQLLHERDDPAAGWDPAVSADPRDPRFSFSFAGRAFFVVGLHPRSSRLARRFRYPALVFNPHAQFERLRREGHFERLRDRIRARDIALQGSINPSLSDFGERSEAEQYSGRDTTEGPWHCPFHRRTP
jgi:FPC/CPF motif-containing protein YcgG